MASREEMATQAMCDLLRMGHSPAAISEAMRILRRTGSVEAALRVLHPEREERDDE